MIKGIIAGVFKSPFFMGATAIIFGGTGFYYTRNTWKSSRKYVIGDQTDKTFIVVGATSGLGKQLTKELASKNATVVMACRNKHKCLEVRRDIVLRTRNKKVYCRMCDISDPSSVHNFVQKLTSAENVDLSKIDGLVLNAATKSPSYKVNADGVELNLATNHMGHFLLVGLLLQKMFEQNVPAKILFIATDISAKDDLELDLNKLNDAKFYVKFFKKSNELLDPTNGKYDMHGAYKFSKLVQLIFARELAERLNENSKISVVAADPGGTKTELNREESAVKFVLTRWATNFLGWLMGSRQKPEISISPILYALCDPDVQNGTFISSRRKQREWGRNAEDNELRQKVWLMSEKWTKLAEHMQTMEEELEKRGYYSRDSEKSAAEIAAKKKYWLF